MEAAISEEIKGALATKAKGATTCVFCGTNEWTLSEMVFWPLHTSGSYPVVQPVVQLICANCGYVMAFNALMLRGV